MPPILFYFANSPAGGGITRLSKYLENIHRDDCLYLGDKRSESIFGSCYSQLKLLHTPLWQRLYDENCHVNKLNLSQTHVFSHGAPIQPKCLYFVLHLNNALPFVAEAVGLPMVQRLKMKLLLERLHRSAECADMITVESESTRHLVSEHWGRDMAAKCQILSNGVDGNSSSKSRAISDPYYLAIGTYTYKQMNKAYLIYREAQRLQENLKFVVVGSLNKSDLRLPGLINYPQLCYEDVRSLLRYSATYITMSKIENCSIALLEAIFEKRRIICSAIPSHREFLEKFSYTIEPRGEVLFAEPCSNTLLPPSWKAISDQTLKLLVP